MSIRPYENSTPIKACDFPSMESHKSWRKIAKNTKFSSKDDIDMHLLCLAACHDTCTIIEFIYENNSKTLNLEDQDGWTPLLCAARHNSLDAAIKLLELGADPNIATIRTVKLDLIFIDHGKIVPIGSTSLWVAAQVTHDVSMTALLLNHGAVATLKFDEKGQKILKEAKNKLDKERSSFLLTLTSSMSMLTNPLLQIVTDYTIYQK